MVEPLEMSHAYPVTSIEMQTEPFREQVAIVVNKELAVYEGDDLQTARLVRDSWMERMLDPTAPAPLAVNPRWL